MNVLHSGTGAASAPLDNATIGVDMSLPLTTAVAVPGRARVAISYLMRSKDADLIVASGRILVGMTGNASYPAPVPALADVATVRNAFVAAVNAAKSGGSIAVIARKQLRAQLVAMLRSLALYVQQNCKGDPLILLGSGYPAQKTRQPAGLLPAPTNLRLARGTISGQLKVRCKKVLLAGSYQWRYATAAAPTAWTQVDPTLSASILLSGLVRGTEYVVQVRALGTQGPSDWSVASTLMVV
jgi:hypothetical protein